MKLTRFLLMMFAALSLAGCVNDDNVDGEIIPVLTDIVTFEGNTDGHSHFTLVRVDDLPPVSLSGDIELNSADLKAGQRVLMAYQPAEGQGAYQSGNITVRAVSLINNGNVEIWDRDRLEGWNDDPVYLYSIWRTGDYINLYCRLIYSTEPRRFALVASESSLETDIVNLYLVHDLPTPVNSHDRAYYASFNIADVWHRSSCKGVRVHVANSNLDKYSFDFLKQ